VEPPLWIILAADRGKICWEFLHELSSYIFAFLFFLLDGRSCSVFSENNGSLPWLGETRTGVGWAQIGCPCSPPSSGDQKAKKKRTCRSSLPAVIISNLGTIRKFRIYLTSNLTCFILRLWLQLSSNNFGTWGTLGGRQHPSALYPEDGSRQMPPHPTPLVHAGIISKMDRRYATKEHASNRSCLCSVSFNIACMKIFEHRHIIARCL